MSWFCRFTAKKWVQVVLLLVGTFAYNVHSSSVTLSAGGNELDNILKNGPIPDTIFFSGAQKIYNLTSYYGDFSGTIHFIGLANDPDEYPILRHTNDKNYNFLKGTNLYFSKVIFDGCTVEFDASDGTATSLTKSFKQCIIRNCNSTSFFAFAGTASTKIIFENCLIVNNTFSDAFIDLSFWPNNPVITINGCTFYGNNKVLSGSVPNNSAITIRNCINYNNTTFSEIDLTGRIFNTVTENPKFAVATNPSEPSDFKLLPTSPARAFCDTATSLKIDIAGNIRGSEDGKSDAGCWALLLGGGPSISIQPADTTVALGASASFSVTADGSEPLTYQWYRNGDPILGATSRVYSIAEVTLEDEADTIVQFFCKVKNHIDSVTSDPCTLFVVRKPDFTNHPDNAQVVTGNPASFTALALRADGYYWLKGDDSIPGSESSTLNLPSVTEEMSGTQYKCVAYNIAGKDTSTPATLTVFGNAPQIIDQTSRSTVIKNNSATIYVIATGSNLKYTWIEIGVVDPLANDNDTLIISSATESKRFICTVENNYGSVTSDTISLVVIDESVKNPIVINKLTFIDRSHVRISIQGFDVLNTIVGDDPYVDTIGIWYEENRFPTTPIRNVPNFLRIPMSEILEDGKSTFEKEFTVNKRECSDYYFVASPFWKNGDDIPPFDTTNGAKLYMCSKDTLENPLTLDIEYSKEEGSIDATVSGFDQIDKDSVDFVLITYKSAGGVTKSDELKSSDLVDIVATWNKKYTDAIFSGAETNITFSVQFRGKLGNYSKVVQKSVTVGDPRTSNHFRLFVDNDSVGSTYAKLRWQNIHGGVANQVRIWYGPEPFPINSDFDTTIYKDTILSAAYSEVRITDLIQNTLYHFGLQVKASGHHWSYITDTSTVSVRTIDPNAIVNGIKIVELRFDSSSNKIILKWDMDLEGISDLKLKTGIWWSIEDDPGNAYVSLMKIDSSMKANLVDSIDLDWGFLFDTTYYFSLHMGYEGKDGEYKWAPPTSDSRKEVRIKHPGWYKASYFESDKPVTAFNQKVVLKPGANWKEGRFDDTLLVFKPNTEQTKPGLIPVGMGVDFKCDQYITPEFYLGIKIDSIPSGYTLNDIHMYCCVNNNWKIMPRTSIDTAAMVISTILKPKDNQNAAFMLMIDNLEPVVTLLSDTSRIISAQSNIIDTIQISDNIINSTLKVLLVNNNDTLRELFSKSATKSTDTLQSIIGPDVVSQNHSVFAYLDVSDGRNTKRINISRKVFVEYTNAKMNKQTWSPVYANSVLNQPSVENALQSVKTGEEWEYDIIHFRIFTWADTGANTNTWVEYSEKNKDIFNLNPGRLLWVKTRDAKAVNLGQGFTFPLKNTFSDVILRAGNYTDVAFPLHFKVIIQDILDSTMNMLGVPGDSLHFYEWVKDETDNYHANALYIPGVPGLDNPRATLIPENCYTIYNSSGQDVILRIPVITEKLSKYASVPNTSLAKSALKEQWSISFNAVTDDGRLSPVYCGFNSGKEESCYPLTPTFSKLKIGVLHKNSKNPYGIVVAKEKAGDGVSYPLIFENGYSEARTIGYQMERLGNIPPNYKVAVFNPESGNYESYEKGVTVAAGEKEFRYLVVGDENFLASWKGKFAKYSFSILKAYPNPFRSRIQIKFMMPYSGVSKMRLAVFDQLGRRLWIKELGSELHPGENVVSWNPANKGKLAAGTYILQLTALDSSGKVKGIKRERIMFMP